MQQIQHRDVGNVESENLRPGNEASGKGDNDKRADQADYKEDNANKKDGSIEESPILHEVEEYITVTFPQAIGIPLEQWEFSIK